MMENKKVKIKITDGQHPNYGKIIEVSEVAANKLVAKNWASIVNSPKKAEGNDGI